MAKKAELALLFGRAFSQSPRYWLNLQADYDLRTARSRHRAVSQRRGVPI